MTNQSARWVEPFAYKAGEPFRIMPVGEFKRGDRTLKITKERLDQMAANANSGRPRWQIPLYAGHPTDQNPDPPKIGNATKLEVRADGLYAYPEYTPDGEKLVKDGAYQFNSPGVMWSLNGSAYSDEQGGQHDNVLDHIALTNRPFFGKATALFSEPGVLEAAGIETMADGTPDSAGLMHRVRTAMGLMKRVISALDVTKATDPDADGDDDTVTHIVNAAPVEGDGGQPAETLPKPAAKGAPVDMTDAGVMKNQLPRAVVAQIETSMTQLSAADKPADNFAGNLPPMIDCPECGTKMPQGAKCMKCGYKDTGEGDKADAEKMSVQRAKATGTAGPQPVHSGSSKKENTMSTPNTAEAFAVNPEEFAAIKAKAEQFEALQAKVDTYAAELQRERNARRLEKFTATAENYTALPVEPKATAEKFAAIEDGAGPEALKWVMDQFAAFDKALTQAGLFDQKVSGRAEDGAQSFADLAAKIHAEKFNSAPDKYMDAANIAREQRPDLFTAYQNDYAQNRGR